MNRVMMVHLRAENGVSALKKRFVRRVYLKTDIEPTKMMKSIWIIGVSNTIYSVLKNGRLD